jgi:hypothetical protein
MLYFCANFIYYPNKININEIYSKEDLIETCEMKKIIISNSQKIAFANIEKPYYYALGYDS